MMVMMLMMFMMIRWFILRIIFRLCSIWFRGWWVFMRLFALITWRIARCAWWAWSWICLSGRISTWWWPWATRTSRWWWWHWWRWRSRLRWMSALLIFCLLSLLSLILWRRWFTVRWWMHWRGRLRWFISFIWTFVWHFFILLLQLNT